MYNRQVLVDYVNGKRAVSDPDVKREFILLKKQAEIDYNEMYAGRNTPETPENIAEDYIDNVKLIARIQRKYWLLYGAAEIIGGAFRVIVVTILALIIPVALSLIGAAYFGFRHTPYITVPIWATFCTLNYLWRYRTSLRYMFNLAPESSIWHNGFLLIVIVIIVGGTFLIAQSAIYFYAGRM